MTEVDINRRLSLAGLGAAALVPLIVGTAAAQTASGSVMDRIMSEKKFKIGYIPSPPSIIKDPASGEIRGFSVDAMRYVCSALKVEPVLSSTFSALGQFSFAYSTLAPPWISAMRMPSRFKSDGLEKRVSSFFTTAL